MLQEISIQAAQNSGGLIGYNYEFTNRWVVGLEAAGGYLWLRDSEGSGIFHTPAVGNFDITTSFKTHYLVTIGPRIGYAFCRWLPYVTGGLAIGDLELSQQIHGHTYFFDEGGSQTETNVGWMVGGGKNIEASSHSYITHLGINPTRSSSGLGGTIGEKSG